MFRFNLLSLINICIAAISFLGLFIAVDASEKLLFATSYADYLPQLNDVRKSYDCHKTDELNQIACQGKLRSAKLLLDSDILIGQYDPKISTPLVFTLLEHGARIALCSKNRGEAGVLSDNEPIGTFRMRSSFDSESVYVFLLLYRLLTKDYTRLEALIARAGYYVKRDNTHIFALYYERIKGLGSLALVHLFELIKEALLGRAKKRLRLMDGPR